MRLAGGAGFFVEKMQKNKGAIVILGGMGPEASAKMLEVMISMAASEFGAKECDDFPEIIVDSIPVPDFISSKTKLPLARRMLTNRVKRLSILNTFCFAIACNTAHIMLEDLKKATSVPFVSMIEAVCNEVERFGIKSVGLLATPSTINSGLYEVELKKRQIDLVTPSVKETRDLEGVVRRVIAGTITEFDRKRLEAIALSLAGMGAQGIILGCTELPLIFPEKFKVPVFDSIMILSRETLSRQIGGEGEL